jgi:prepilin-type N-terminal cleavage/methylation domain-containing protein
MKYGRQTPNPPHDRAADAGDGRRAGFTLIEVVIAIVILGILSAAVAVNWSSFIRYQELRQDAHGLHKELLALKAKAQETDTTVTVTFKKDTYEYTVQIFVPSTSNPDEDMDSVFLHKSLNKNVKIVFPTDIGTSFEGIDPVDVPNLTNNEWKETGGVKITNESIDPFNEGWVVISNDKNKQFCIIKTKNSIKPELYSRTKSGTGGTWKRI